MRRKNDERQVKEWLVQCPQCGYEWSMNRVSPPSGNPKSYVMSCPKPTEYHREEHLKPYKC